MLTSLKCYHIKSQLGITNENSVINYVIEQILFFFQFLFYFLLFFFRTTSLKIICHIQHYSQCNVGKSVTLKKDIPVYNKTTGYLSISRTAFLMPSFVPRCYFIL